MVYEGVVYLLIPTSNHNTIWRRIIDVMLYIFWFLHQTTTSWFHPTSPSPLYIFWFLHQTTTSCVHCRSKSRCISFDSYIKPQLLLISISEQFVVYLLIPTSNHNARTGRYTGGRVVYLLIPTSNHNGLSSPFLYCKVVYLLIPTSNHNSQYRPQPNFLLYIFWFLHQTTTFLYLLRQYISCISFDSYIKPQQC